MGAVAIVLALVAGLAGEAGAAVTMVRDGRTDHAIVLSADATAPERRAAAELQSHMECLSGAKSPILTLAPGESPPDRAILVGPGAAAAAGEAIESLQLGGEDFVLRTRGERVVVAGGRPRGTMYAATTLLEQLGVRWFTPTVTRFPMARTVAVGPIDRVFRPAFEYRETFFTEAFDRDWSARLKINGSSIRADESTGGRVRYAQFVHTLDSFVPRSLYASHPEYFPLIDGQRVDGDVQRCLSNPEVLRLAIEGVRRAFAADPEASITSVSQNDNQRYCRCDACTALAARFGEAQAGVYLWFANRVAEAIEKDHPGKLIDTLAYQFTEPAPAGIVPRHNVRVRLCPIAVCLGHPYLPDTDPKSRAFVRALGAWAKLSDTLYVWHYNTNFAHYLAPFPDFGQFPSSLRLYREMGAKGVFFQGGYAPGGGASDAELRSYVMAQLLWDPDRDADTLVNEWMAGVYGRAAAPMRAWFDLLHDTVRAHPDRHFNCYAPVDAFYLSPENLAAGATLHERALELAGDDDIARRCIENSRLSLRYVEVMRRGVKDASYERFLREVRAAGITQLREGQSLETWEARFGS